jgi:hypothetical protein
MGFYSKYINKPRLIALTEACTRIFNEVPDAIKGNQSLAALVYRRIESICTTEMEIRYCVDCVTEMIKQSSGKEVKILDQFGNDIDPKTIKLITNDPALLK